MGAHTASTEVGEPAAELLYERDPYAWSIEQARLLREGRLDEIDVPNVADEILSVGKQELGHLEEALIALFANMLLWDDRPERRTRERAIVIAEQRCAVEDRLRRSPGLRAKLDKAMQWSFHIGRLQAAADMDIEVTHFPESSPYDWEAIVSRPFEPKGEAAG